MKKDTTNIILSEEDYIRFELDAEIRHELMKHLLRCPEKARQIILLLDRF